MALIIENGTVVANANSYSTLDQIKAYATSRNYALPDDDTVVEGYAVRATDYLETYRDQYQGELVDPNQSLAFPRKGMVINDVEWPENTIPPQIIKAQQQLVIEQSRGVVLNPTLVYQDRVKRKKIDRLETEWFDSAATGIDPDMSLVNSILSGLLKPQVFGLRTVRV